MPSPRNLRILALALVAVTAGLYWQTTHHDFAAIDDDQYVSGNPWVTEGLSWEATRWAFTTYYAANWHPLTWLSHQADWSIYGSFAGGHHLTNLLLHTVNTLLVFLLLRSLTGNTGPSWVVAALFGWHPLHVESAAWIAERKDLLSTLCLLGSLWAYCQHAKAQQIATRDPRSGARTLAWKYYGMALGIFAAGLMCKPMLVTLPCLLLLLDYWPLQRIADSPAHRAGQTWVRLFIEKLPFFALSAVACLLTLAAQHGAGAIKDTQQVPLTLRGINALSAYGQYLMQTFWPYPLCIFYPLPEELPLTGALVGALLLGGLTLVAVRSRRPCPWFITGWFWFLGSLVPVIGLVQVGMQAHADRYTYIPSIGLFIALAWGAQHVLGRWCQGKQIAIGLAGASLAGCLVLSHLQLGYWRDSVKLFTHSLAHTRNNGFAQNNLGVALSNLGKPNEAMVHYREAIRLEPNYPRARFNLGVLLAGAGQLDEAIQQFTKALQYSPHSEMLLNNLGVVLAQQGKTEEALGQFRQAIRWNPSYPKSYINAGAAFQVLGQAGAAVTNYTTALRLDPNSLETLRHLALLFATYPAEPYHQPQVAIQLAKRATEITQNQVADYLGTLAIAYAAAGQYSNAITIGEKGLRLAQEHGISRLTAKLQSDLEAYRTGRNPEHDWKQAR
jgi:protein O-mannosyl-transferase